MAGTASELYEKRTTGKSESNGVTHSRSYVVTAATDDSDAITAVEAEAPATYATGGKTVQLTDIEVRESKQSDLYFATASYVEVNKEYKKKQPPLTGEEESSFDAMGDPLRIRKALTLAGVVQQTKFPAGAKDRNGLIGVQPDGTVEGVEGIAPLLRFNLTRYKAAADITTAYVQTLASLVGTRNDAAFRSFDTGQLLLTQITGQERQNYAADWAVTISCVVGEEIVAEDILGIAAVTADFHDVVDVEFERALVGVQVIERARAVYVSTIYKKADWTALGF